MRLSFIISLTLAAGCFLFSVEGSCPDGYCRHSNGCYLVVGLEVSWIDARNYCTVLGGTLLSVTSSTAQTAVDGALRKLKGTISPGIFWLDFTDILNPRDWRTMSDKQALTYGNWNIKFSYNGTISENCVHMNESADYTWTTVSCSEKLNFVCYSAGTPRVQHYDPWSTISYDDYDDADTEDVQC